MAVLYGTLGFRPQKFLAAIPLIGGHLERAVVYTSATGAKEKEKSEIAFSQVRMALNGLNVRCERRELSSPWDFSEIARAFIQDLSNEEPTQVVFNLTGGPKTMAVAATIACLLHGVRVLYVPEEEEGSGAPVELPLLRVRYSQVLTETQQKVLRNIRDNAPRSLDELATSLHRSNSAITSHVQSLAALGALAFLPNLKDRLRRAPRLTQAGELMLMAEEVLAKRDRMRA